MKIILVGGGTLGSVSPLIAIWQSLKKLDNNLQTFFIGSYNGPEVNFVEKYHLKYLAIASGKFRRYFSLLNFVDLFKIIIAYLQSIILLNKIKPDAIVSAGGFLAVPLIWASKLFTTKVVLYQSDLKIGLANKLCLKSADYLATTFKETLVDSSSCQVECVGTVLREEIDQASQPTKNKPTILILGGGTGAQAINDLIDQSLSELTRNYLIIHVRGKNKGVIQAKKNYESAELLTADYFPKIREADLVISRAGISAIMELAYLAKPIILIPLPNSPQAANAQYLQQRKAAVLLKQEQLTSAVLINQINYLISDQNKLTELSSKIHEVFQHHGSEKIARKIYELKSI